MVAFLPFSRPKWWFSLVLLLMLVLFLFWKLAPGRFVNVMDRLSPFHIGTPRISGTVVDAVTGRPVPGIDVCLLVTYSRLSFVHAPTPDVLRSVMTQSDASGRFFFARWDAQLDLSDHWGGYGIAVTDPVARWKEVCGRELYLLGKTDIFECEIRLNIQSGSAAQSPPPYFPVAMVNDFLAPEPPVYGTEAFFGHFPEGSLVRKIGDPNKLRIALVPLLRNQDDCRSAPDSDSAELCRVMNGSSSADDLRTMWKFPPTGR